MNGAGRRSPDVLCCLSGPAVYAPRLASPQRSTDRLLRRGGARSARRWSSHSLCARSATHAPTREQEIYYQPLHYLKSCSASLSVRASERGGKDGNEDANRWILPDDAKLAVSPRVRHRAREGVQPGATVLRDECRDAILVVQRHAPQLAENVGVDALDPLAGLTTRGSRNLRLRAQACVSERARAWRSII